MKKAVSMPMHFRRSSGFTLLEVMIAAALVAVAVGAWCGRSIRDWPKQKPDAGTRTSSDTSMPGPKRGSTQISSEANWQSALTPKPSPSQQKRQPSSGR
ncbi:MAG TPA: prepilin-type N-terminal cleavage/methylation domain-containing protein, partial [Deltaproteobacteria bacterium]|nr:prepilin-type N-terminal cleavage/methylation domain-containing protein [Deltaproteobacteria bacterium]